MKTPSRRQALATIAAAGAAPAVLSAAEYSPSTFSPERYRLLALLVDVIIPDADTPGAAEAGVARMIDEDAATNKSLRAEIDKMLARFERDRFASLSPANRNLLMTDYMTASDERGESFSFLKEAVIDRYYSTEVGLVDELGYQGNTYLAEFPGCRHNHQLEDAE